MRALRTSTRGRSIPHGREHRDLRARVRRCPHWREPGKDDRLPGGPSRPSDRRQDAAGDARFRRPGGPPKNKPASIRISREVARTRRASNWRVGTTKCEPQDAASTRSTAVTARTMIPSVARCGRLCFKSKNKGPAPKHRSLAVNPRLGHGTSAASAGGEGPRPSPRADWRTRNVRLEPASGLGPNPKGADPCPTSTWRSAPLS